MSNSCLKVVDDCTGEEEAAQSRAVVILRTISEVVWWEVTYEGEFSANERADIVTLTGATHRGNAYSAFFANVYEVKAWSQLSRADRKKLYQDPHEQAATYARDLAGDTGVSAGPGQELWNYEAIYYYLGDKYVAWGDRAGVWWFSRWDKMKDEDWSIVRRYQKNLWSWGSTFWDWLIDHDLAARRPENADPPSLGIGQGIGELVGDLV